MAWFKKRFRQIKKLPDWVFMPLVLLVKIMKSCMRTEVRDPFNAADPAKFPYVTVTWHNRLLFFPAMFPYEIRRRTSAVISASRDGQYVADVARLFGLEVIRGSSYRRGAGALSEAFDYLARGYNVSITPDGPRGPKYTMSNGPVILASKTGFPVLPIAVNSSSYWEIKSWDRFRIPKPWAKVTLVLGEPIKVPPNLSDEDMEKWRKILEDKLKEVSMD